MNEVTVHAPDGQRRTLRSGQSLLFGRPGGGADLLLGDDVHLSRQHGLIQAGERGWLLTNISEINPLYVDTLDGALIPVRPGARWDADRAQVTVGTASMVHLERPLWVTCLTPPEVVDPRTLGLPAISGEATEPAAGVSLAPDAQYFLTAVLLCRPWLRDPLRITRLPTAAEIVADVRRLTGVDGGATEELERFVVTDLKALKQKMLDARVFTERPVSVGMLAAALIGHGLVTPVDVHRIADEAREWRYRWRSRLAQTGPAAR
ncbi:hypothetical protein BH20ACT5_BH20ACT5_18800 [soil metagenome]